MKFSKFSKIAVAVAASMGIASAAYGYGSDEKGDSLISLPVDGNTTIDDLSPKIWFQKVDGAVYYSVHLKETGGVNTGTTGACEDYVGDGTPLDVTHMLDASEFTCGQASTHSMPGDADDSGGSVAGSVRLCSWQAPIMKDGSTYAVGINAIIPGTESGVEINCGDDAGIITTAGRMATSDFSYATDQTSKNYQEFGIVIVTPPVVVDSPPTTLSIVAPNSTETQVGSAVELTFNDPSAANELATWYQVLVRKYTPMVGGVGISSFDGNIDVAGNPDYVNEGWFNLTVDSELVCTPVEVDDVVVSRDCTITFESTEIGDLTADDTVHWLVRGWNGIGSGPFQTNNDGGRFRGDAN